MKQPLSQRWDLDVIFTNGSASPEFAEYLNKLEAEVKEFTTRVNTIDENATIEAWREIYELLQTVGATMKHGGAFISCLISQDVKDNQAKLLQGRISQINASTTAGVCVGDDRGRLDRSANPARPSCSYQASQRCTACRDTPNRAATSVTGDPARTSRTA